MIAAGLFFMAEGLGRADQWASVGSFLLASAVAASTLIAAIRNRRSKDHDAVTEDGNTAVNCGTVVMGPGATVSVVNKNRWWRWG